jgi:hypothetical protein
MIKRAYSVMKREWFFTLGAIRQIHQKHGPIYGKFFAIVPALNALQMPGDSLSTKLLIQKQNFD